MNLLDQISAAPMALRDMAALAFLFVAWLGIGWFTERPPAGRPSVSVLMTRYRREWMRHFVDRDPRGHIALATLDARMNEFADRVGDAYRDQQERLAATGPGAAPVD